MQFLGKRFKIARIEKDLRQNKCAEILGVSSNFISLIENEKRHPSMKLLNKAALVFGKDMNYFFASFV